MVPSTVRCHYCRKKIGLLRRLFGQQFCCADHRRKLASGSARALREAEDLYGVDEVHSATWRSVTEMKREDKEERKASLGASIFIGSGIVLLLGALSQMPNSPPAPKVVSSLPDNKPQHASSGFAQVLGNLVQSKASSNLRDDFRAGLANWEGQIGGGSDWVSQRGVVRPSSLRIWKPSIVLSNYQMEFMGQIDRKSMDWAFRASDTKNYYATKLVITRPGPQPNAGLVRFVVLDGRERERVELPLPLTLERGVDYRIRVNVEGTRFLTSVNGQLVSSWSDNRLSHGGVGFFADEGESAVLKWVSVSERDSFLARIASHFSLIAFPAMSVPTVE
ncbi:MAG TPA: hypothetical protein VKX49_11840 [Bryobacteraceae bacterium]|nr:hypothetical protein [Bryobacteraceae bacterium]